MISSGPSSSLPVFAARAGRDAAALAASRAVVDLFLRARSSDFTVRQLADHAGLSERTFYRYFPRKEDAVRPYFRAALDAIVDGVRAAPTDRPLPEVLVTAHAAIFEAGRGLGWEALLPVLEETDRLRAVWLQVLTEAEAAFAEVIAARLGLAGDALEARLAGAVVVAAARVALQPGVPAAARREPGEVFAACVARVGGGVFGA